jgi:hypothetical protein
MQVFDERWMPVVKELYNNNRELGKVSPAYREPGRSGADVLAAYREKVCPGGPGRLVEKPINAFIKALIEARIPFDMVDSHYIDREHLSKYRAVILPNIAVLSDADAWR